MLSFRLITFRSIIFDHLITLKDHWFDSHRLPKSNNIQFFFNVIASKSLTSIRGLNPWPLGHEPSALTTRPWLEHGLLKYLMYPPQIPLGKRSMIWIFKIFLFHFLKSQMVKGVNSACISTKLERASKWKITNVKTSWVSFAASIANRLRFRWEDCARDRALTRSIFSAGVFRPSLMSDSRNKS